MCKKLILLWVTVSICLVSGTRAANIIWIGETDDQNADGKVDDAQWPTWLTEQGYSVNSQPNNWLTLDAAKIETLNKADLVIVGRNTDSGDYINGQEITQWNSVTAPVLLLTPYLSRANRWRWLNADGLTVLAGAPAWEAVVPTHPVFAGVTLDATNRVAALDGSIASLGTAHVGAGVGLGNGVLIARVPGTGEAALAEWAPGVAFYNGGPMVAGRRLLFCAGTTESGTSFPQGAFNLTGAGQKMLLNAIGYMLGGVQRGQAVQPAPVDEATGVPLDAVLSWSAGEFAATHDVYLGTNPSDVANASRTKPLSVLVSQGQDANTYEPTALQLERTYYWRVDEVNRAPDTTIIKGSVWSFTTEPIGYLLAGKSITATASSVNSANMGPEKTVDGSGLNAGGQHANDPATMWLSSTTGPQPAWIQYGFDRVYKLHQMRVWNSNQILEPSLGLGAKSVTIEYSLDGATWTSLPKAQFVQASGAASDASITTVSLGGAVAQYVRLTIESNWGGGLLAQYGLSEVQFFYVPVSAREPSPASGAAGVNPEVTLRWRGGREAASHQVYLSPDKQKVIDGTAVVATLLEPRFETAVDLAQTYYWKVVEVNEAANPPSWEGDIWDFSTPTYISVEDFESYTDDVGKEIFTTWVDGYGTKTNGAVVGHEKPPFAERTILHGGRQSMPLTYDNSAAANSAAERTFGVAQDWTKHGVTTLVVYFCGSPANTGGSLYVKINGTKKVTYSGSAGALTRPWWTQWNIDLLSLGINLQKITGLTVGIEGGGKGIVYLDDIRLYQAAPPVAGEEVWIEAESAKAIPNRWEVLLDRADASGGKHLGVKAGNNSMDVPPATDGTITYPFTVKGGTYTIRARAIVPTADDNSLWLRVRGATTQTAIHADGWVWWYDIAVGNAWHWDVVRSHDDGDKTVRFTLPAGTYNLEVAYREDGLLLDAILITDQLD